MGKVWFDSDKIYFQKRDEYIVIEPWGSDCLRFRSTRNIRISDENWTLLERSAADGVKTSGDNYSVTIENGRMSARIEDAWGGPRVVYFKDGRQILATKKEGDSENKFLHISGDNYRVRMTFEANEGEHIYGLGQEQENQFDRKGCSVELCHYNTKSALGVAYSSLGYGFFWNNPSPGRAEFTYNHTLWQADSAYQADYLVFAGETPAETMKIYCELTGFPSEFPAWAAGFWQCKLRYESQDDLLAVAREYKKRNIPVSAIVIDYFHWTEQGNWEFDPDLWHDPSAMVKELDEMGVRTVVSIWPTINPNSRNYRAMNDGNMLIRNENGQFGQFDFYGQQAFVDFTNPDARKFVWDRVRENYYSHGIKTFWLDEAEPEVHPQQFGNLRFYEGNGAQVAMLYPYYYVKAFYEGLEKEGESEILSLTRAAYPGSQKYGAVVWNGDIMSSFEALEMSIKSGLSMAMCGIPWWNSDIGGFHAGDIESDYFRELIVRWFQFGLFCPIMRLHGARRRTKDQIDRHPGVKERSGGDNEIWSFGERDYPILKSLIELRERLRPYICECMKAAHEKGEPVMRPMFFEFCGDEKCYCLDDQYMFGHDILFAPIYKQGVTRREVYLPQGNWVSVLDGKTYAGGQTVSCDAPLDKFIAFIREGAEVINAFSEE